MIADAKPLALIGWLGGALVCALGCDPITALRPDLPDAGTEAEGCDEVTPAARVLATNCAVSGACHVPGGQYPDLSRAGLELSLIHI